jgi:predicted enzyme related to lactoylglutathione lyase
MLNPTVPAWFEIPVRDLDRAQRFYETILGVDLRRQDVAGSRLAVFPYGGRPNHVSGALLQNADCEPAVQGSIVYLAVDDLRPVLQRAESVGGDTLVPVTELPAGMGYFAQFRDCEGNRVGLWSAA